MLQSERLTLRAVEPTDADFMYDVENDPAAWLYADTVAPLSRRIIRDYAMNYNADPYSDGQLRLIATLRESSTPVGIVDLYEISARHRRACIGIYILPDFRRRGLASEAIAAIGDYASEALGLHKVWARISHDNHASEKAFSSAGFRLEATLKDWLLTSDGPSDINIYSKTLNPKP